MTELPHDSQSLDEVEHLLERERPVPNPAFRGDLRRRLMAGDATRPSRVRLAIAAYAGSGGVLMLGALAGVLGAGPLAG